MKELMALSLSFLMLSACARTGHRNTAPILVQEEWQRYEETISKAQRRALVDRNEFEAIRSDMWTLTGIRLPDIPTDTHSQSAFKDSHELLQQWYMKNQARLYWSSRGKRMQICTLGAARGGVAAGQVGVAPVWQSHMSVLEDMMAGRPFQIEDFADAHTFFFDLTNISIPADHSPVADLMPVPDSKNALPILNDWYLRNKGQIYWDESTGTPKLRQ